MRTIGIIPLRAGSKRIPDKNTKDMAGKPLYRWVLDAAVKCDLLNDVVVATDIPDFPDGEGYTVYYRSAESASDTAQTEVVIDDVLEEYDNDYNMAVLLQATNPFIQPHDIGMAIHLCYTNFDSVLSCTVVNDAFYWTKFGEPINYEVNKRPLGGPNEPIMRENGAIYVSTSVKPYRRLCGRTGMYIMPHYTSRELDELEDWPIVEELMRKHRCK